jgi:hypothetical protein
VVGDDEKIEWSLQLCRLARRGRDFLTFGEAVCIARQQPCAEGASVKRERGVKVRVAEKRPGREIAAGPGRIGALGGKDLLRRRLVERADVSDEGVLGKGDSVKLRPVRPANRTLTNIGYCM